MDSPANPNIHNIVKTQIVFLLSTLTEENFERNQVEIRSVSTLLQMRDLRAERARCDGLCVTNLL